MRKLSNILVTGGAGFIGVNFIRFLFENSAVQQRIINLDSLTYAGNAASLKDINEKFGGTRYFFEYGSICDKPIVEDIFQKYDIDTVIHFAAETHVDRSILGPKTFMDTNVMGTFVLLETARKFWKNADGTYRNDVLFHHVSTDEVYGSLGITGFFTETSPYNPSSPYSASKAAADHLVKSYFCTYGLPVTISNSSNNYGPYQFPEKLIPLMILNMIDGKELPLYGDGKNVRDWLYVNDHNAALWTIAQKGRAGETYVIGGDNEWENIELVYTLINIIARKTGKDADKIRDSITYVKDRPGHDRRYAADCSKIKIELGWEQSISREEGFERTIDWYMINSEWTRNVQSGEYRNWLELNYNRR